MAELKRLTDPNAVLAASALFDAMGREAFLARYQFGRSTKYRVRINGKLYDSKALVGVAFGIQHPTNGPLTPGDFNGGHKSSLAALRRLGFTDIEDAALTPLVLSENEQYAGTVYGWHDVTGERYQFPNQYRTRIVPGVRFLYYKGVRRKSGPRSDPQYFGTGIVGDVYPDESTSDRPTQQRQWIAEIAEYVPFANPVAFRDAAGVLVETGTTSVASNYWGVGVRPIEEDRFQAILAAAGTPAVSAVADFGLEAARGAASPALPALAPTTEPLLILKRPTSAGTGARVGFDSRRLSHRAREIGCAAEELFFAYLVDQESDLARKAQIVWVARDGLTPGYDIEDRRDPVRTKGYEVKGTTGPTFPGFDMTANEIAVAEALRERYFIVLVSQCLSETPRFEVLQDPFGLVLAGTLSREPIAFRLEGRIAAHALPD